MSKFTPGPWSISEDVDSAIVCDTPIKNGDKTGHNNKDYYGGYLICESVRNNPDANLIAAAPEMYEALKEMYTYMFEQSGHFRGSNFEPMKLRAEHALAKAEGREK